MCNRYAQTKDSARLRLNTVGQREFSFRPRYNVSPTQQVDVVRMERGDLVQSQMKWGWHHPKFGAITNAQAETAYQKMFKDAWKNCRCVVPSDGFYEWKKGTPAQPYRIVMPTRKLFWFAGLWNEGEVLILTAPASSWLTSIHDRQPVVLPEKDLDWWLGPADEQCHEGWAVIRRGVSMYAFEAYPVTPKMSNPRFDSPECVEPITPAQDDLFKLAIDDTQQRWRDISDSPPLNTAVDLLMDDDEIAHGQWDGSQWSIIRAGDARPLMWRRQRSSQFVNSNAIGK